MPIDDSTPRPPSIASTQHLQSTRWVLVKLDDAVRLPHRDDVEAQLEAFGFVWWARLKHEFPGIRIRRLYTSLGPERLEELVERAAIVDPTYRPPNFGNYFGVEIPATLNPAALVTIVSQLPFVEFAHVAPAGRLSACAGTPAYTQGHLHAAPDGIDAQYAWTVGGGDGANQAVVDIEAGWCFDQCDLQLPAKTLLGTGPSSTIYEHHGTAVLGILVAQADGTGCNGIAPAAQVSVISVASSTPPHLIQAALLPDAITVALDQLSFGNVLLIEVEIAKTDQGVTRYVPCEAEPTFFEPIRLATALGIVVIEVAGSNDVDLDTFMPADAIVLNPALHDFQDSGAILVGGATCTDPHSHLNAASAYGARIDSYGWGESVSTCWSDSSGSTSAFTNTFNGTSAAAAIVAGGVLCIQGMIEHLQGRRLSPAEMRELLRDPANGTPVGGRGAGRTIPNLRQIATAIGASPDVFVRDYVGDVGDPDGVSRAMSPDIIVANNRLGDPEGTYGTGSGTEDIEGLGDPVVTGQDNFVYVRVRNRGGSDAANVEVTVYWSEPSTLITPDAWHLLGSTTIPAVVRGNQLTVSPPITWSASDIPGAGHFCLVAIVGDTPNAVPLRPVGAISWDNFVRFVSVNNNVAWRNFDIVTLDPATDETIELEFEMRGAPDRGRPMTLELVAQLPERTAVTVSASTQVLDLWRRRSPFVRVERGRASVPASPNGRTTFPALTLPARVRVPLRVTIRRDKRERWGTHDVFVRQLSEGKEVGRVTWRLTGRRRG